MELTAITVLLVVIITGLAVWRALNIVPQSMVFVVERFGKFDRTLHPGLNFIIPGFEYVAHRISILERQLPTTNFPVITADNTQVNISMSVFYRITAAEKAVYRIANVDNAVATTTTGIIRAACGELSFDEVQTRREFLNQKIASELANAIKDWGIDITRAEVLDVVISDVMRDTMLRQMAADRDRRAVVLKAEGERDAIQLAADAALYRAQKEAEATRARADADAYATTILAKAISDNGQAAIDFEIMKRKITAIQNLSASPNSKILLLPSDVTGVLGSLTTLTELASRRVGEG